ncbi:hypothetical protein HPB49_020306 [Dermacentor silvarum]|uniref:Uncharacterized protein n=1 Tax=Dermacentor silvarum TaxID=543639 RepID=A0ACB8CMG7_DERSI|nr:hypothetical protein HPB49_020306 [Dermacentor silvarum]
MALELWYTNCRSVKNKLVDLQSTIAALPANTVILLTETWLDPGVLDGELMDISSHTIFRRDRRGRGGGVLVATPVGISAHRRHDLEHDDLEAIFLSFTFPEGLFLLDVSTARPSSEIAPTGCLMLLCPQKLLSRTLM